jgi:hypothetical protein
MLVYSYIKEGKSGKELWEVSLLLRTPIICTPEELMEG